MIQTIKNNSARIVATETQRSWRRSKVWLCSSLCLSVSVVDVHSFSQLPAPYQRRHAAGDEDERGDEDHEAADGRPAHADVGRRERFEEPQDQAADDRADCGAEPSQDR